MFKRWRLCTLRNVFRCVVLTLSTIICAKQVSDIFQLYFKFETVVAVKVSILETPFVPAVTVCYKNILKKSEICKWKAIRLGMDCDNFAEEYSKNETMLLEMIYDIVNNINDTNQLKAMGYSMEEAFDRCDFTPDVMDFPYQIIKCWNNTRWIFTNKLLCHAINVQWFRTEGHSFHSVNKYTYQIFINLNPPEFIYKEETPRVEFIVHNPSIFPPIASEVKGLLGYHYEIGTEQSSIELMQPPYGKPCKYYYEEWLANKTNEASKQVCVYFCKRTKALEICNCVVNRDTMFENDRLCPFKYVNSSCLKPYQESIKQCETECVRDCTIHMFDPDMERMSLKEYNPIMTAEKLNRSTSALITLKRQREVRYIHSPKITPTEIFGYIGGFVGFWLGLSIPQLLDCSERFIDKLQNLQRKGGNWRHSYSKRGSKSFKSKNNKTGLFIKVESLRQERSRVPSHAIDYSKFTYSNNHVRK